MDEFINLSISGVKYSLCCADVKKYPNTLLAALVDLQQSKVLQNGCSADANQCLPKGFRYNQLANEFYVLRSPKLFESILIYYASGVFHSPNDVCFNAIEEELSFWRIDQPNFQSCCSDTANRDHECVPAETAENTESYETDCRKQWQIYVWKLWNQPDYSLTAKSLTVATMVFTCLSIVNMVVGSLPNLQYCSHNTTWSGYFAEPPMLLLKIKCTGTLVFVTIEALCTLWLTVEFVCRLITSPTKRRFLFDTENVIDFLSIIPFYVEMIVWGWIKEQPEIYGTLIVTTVMLISHLLRIARLLKLCRYSQDLRILAGTFRSAKRELLMLTLFTIFGLLLFATLLYYIEKDEIDTRFSSIPASCWWAIVTLTTAGYGDVTPQTTIGKVVAGVACVTGILMMALPIAVLVENFTTTYTKRVIVKPIYSNKFNVDFKTKGSDNSVEESRKFTNVTTRHQSVDSFLSDNSGGKLIRHEQDECQC